MVDYIVVGSGLAGIAFAETALSAGKTVLMYGDDSHNASRVAGGLYNPVILKRFSGLKDAGLQIRTLRHFYARLQEKIGVQVEFPMPMLRKFMSVEEVNNWFVASDKVLMSDFLSPEIVHLEIGGIDAPLGYGQVLETGYVDTGTLLQHYKEYMVSKGMFKSERFAYDMLEVGDSGVSYQDVQARHVVFCEGYGLKANPYFNYLPLNGTKGELLLINAPDLKLEFLLNTNVFVLPLGNGLFKAGATYEWEDKTELPTAAGREELEGRIREVINCDFEVIDQYAGVRPTVSDRRPLLGTHPECKPLHILNGLGTRGVMLGPVSAEALFAHIQTGAPIDREISIERFLKHYAASQGSRVPE